MTGKSAHALDRVYVLVCKGDDCSRRGNPEMIRVALKQIARSFPAKKVKVSYVSCLGLCGEGPNVVIFSDGEVFSRCGADGIEEIAKAVGERIGKHPA